MTTETKNIELDHVGPIAHLTIPIPEGGGIVCLKGKNGTGKSHALNSVESLYSKEARKQLRHSDGVPSGKVEGLGVSVRLGRSNTAKGELVCDSLDGRVDPSKLVDPGIKDPLSADSKRLATLIRLAGIEVTEKTWLKAIGEASQHVELSLLVAEDPIVTAERIRRALHEQALKREKLSESKHAESKTLGDSIADIDIKQNVDPDVLANNLDEATSALARAEQQQAESKRAHEACAHAKQELENLPPLDTELLGQEFMFADRKVAELEAELESVKQRLSDAERLRDKKAAEHEAAVQRDKDRAKFAEIINADQPGAPSDEEIAKLKEAKEQARQAVQNGEVVRRAQSTQKKATGLLKESQEYASIAETLRKVARSTDDVLEEALVEAGFDTVKVHDGRLCVDSDRGLEPFSDLSHGERWRMALDLAAAGLPKGSVLPVCQEAFESLDPENRDHINQLARERSLVIVTAEATDGDLRAEVL